ncbi:hypothetical protein BX666DRAFT_604794 [Dichotomocladium elegans]|nr:hypothetical protein BX666DRAFT_604794 [Dichotomocladium elegans]
MTISNHSAVLSAKQRTARSWPSRKLLRQLEDLSEQALMLKSEHLHRFKTLYAISSKLSQFCFETYKQITSYIAAKQGSKEEISLSLIQQIVYNKADEILEIAETSLWEGCLRTLKSLSNELNATITRVDNDNKMDKIVTGIAPWIQRASDMKAEVVVSHDMERKLQQHTEEILKLIKDIKLKDQALQESNVKVELLEKRMVVVKKQAEQIATLEEQLTKSQSQERVYAEAIENLQADFDALDQEHTKLKTAAAQSEMKWQMASDNKKSTDTENASDPGSTANDAETGSSTHVTGQLETLKAAIQYLRSENAHLKARDMAAVLQLEKLPETTRSTEEQVDNSALKAVALEARVLLKDMRIAGAVPKVVALDAKRRQGKWQSRKCAPDYQYQAQQSVLYTLKQRSDQLRGKLEQVRPSAATATANATSATNTSARSTLQTLTRSLARIQIPGLPSSSRRIQLSSAAEFERIHSVFLR